ncbi:MAG TPA: TonB-dependent receptor [Candidatus Acidoferrum sp.]|nr:TonB-dependent receptor [Candidatus Acidoferrum sp.]
MHCTSARRLSFLFAIIFLFGTGIARSQSGTASLHGTVTDPKGASVPNAEVTITNAAMGVTQTTHTDKNGSYQFLELHPATYTLIVTAPGFAKVRQSGLVLLVATPTTNDVKLEISSGMTTVEVIANTQTINTQDATIGNAFNQSQIAALPFEGRDPTAILSLQPGVVTVGASSTINTDSDSRGGSVNGARSDQTNVTLDGVDDNDQTKGYALQGALRATLDSLEEFRVTTTNAGADQGRSSGAQVALVTKSGTNELHGSAYEYNRPKGLVANDWFNKHAELQNGEPNTPPSLLRNTFGGSVGGPIKKDRLFFFLAYEGQRTREATQTIKTVPSDTLREGIMLYQCDNPALCPGGTQQVQGIDPTTLPSSLTPKTYTVNVPQGYYALGSPQIAQMDPNCSANGVCPWGPGVDPYALQSMNMYPHSNSTQLGDGYNYLGYTFSAATPNKLDTYVAKFDANLNRSGTQRVFVRLGLENDHSSEAPQFPGQPPTIVQTNNSKGIIAGYTWAIDSTRVNNLRYGFIRQGVGNDGSGATSIVYQRGLDPLTTDQRSTNYVVPVHNIADDFSWTRGKHTIQFGVNWRYINDQIASNNNSFSDATTNAGWLPSSAVANTGGTLDPGAVANGCTTCTWNFPSVASSFGTGYDFPIMALVGPISEYDAYYQLTKTGTLLPDGVIVNRHFRVNETDLYLQDAWRIKPNLTMTVGLRYSLLQPPYETNGNQVAPNLNLSQFFTQRMAAMDQGLSYSPTLSVDLAGPANGKPGFWNWDYKDLAPRFSLAWSPGASDGLWGSIFGGPGKTSIRLGSGIYYDHFGLATVNTFDAHGSYGLTTAEITNFGSVNVDTAPRYTSPNLNDPSYISLVNAGLVPPAPSGSPYFPQTPPLSNQPGGFSPYWGLDTNMKTPYSYDFDLSVSRETKGGFVVEAAYVGRLGRRLLQERDLAQPLNIVDPASKTSYYQAITQLTKLAEAKTPIANVPNIPYWQNLFPGAQNTSLAYLQANVCQGTPNAPPGGASNLTATQAVYFVNACNLNNETTTLQYLDLYCIPACPTINGVQTEGLQYYMSQFPSLYAWQSIGRSNYNAGQFSIRHKVTHGLQWDFNYVYSKSFDMGSNAERISSFENEFGLASQIYNAFQPGQNRAISDYDTTHQINSNWVYELPFGHGKKWGNDWGRAMEAVLGGWSWSGLYRWTSGFPFSIGNGFKFPTDWELTGNAVQIAPIKTGLYTDANGDPNAFAAAATPGGVASLLPGSTNPSFRFAYAGESGNRNNFRGQGNFDIDMALRKSWNITERQSLSFTYDVYNITNSVRFGFDAYQYGSAIDTAGSFGNYNQTITRPRVMEFALRYSF